MLALHEQLAHRRAIAPKSVLSADARSAAIVRDRRDASAPLLALAGEALGGPLSLLARRLGPALRLFGLSTGTPALPMNMPWR